MFSENMYFWQNFDFTDKNYFSNVLSLYFDICDGSIVYATKFHGDEIYFILSISVRSKVIDT